MVLHARVRNDERPPSEPSLERDEAEEELDWIFEIAEAEAHELAGMKREEPADAGTLVREIADDARVGHAPGRERIVQAVERKHDAIAEIIARIAPHMGLDPSVVVVDLSDKAKAIAARGGSVAVALEGRVYLDGGRFDPYSPHGREVLAHELAHLAQWQLGRDAGASPMPRALAEAEASAIGRCFVTGHSLPRPIVPLSGSEPAAFSPGSMIMGALGTLAGDLRGRFAESLVSQLEGTIGAPLIPGLQQWGAGALDANEQAPVEDGKSDDQIADELGHAGADTLVAGGKLTLFFIRAFFAVASKLRLLPRGVEVVAGPIKVFVGGTGSFKQVEFYGRVEIDWGALMSWLADLTGQGVGAQPAEGSEGEKKGGIHLLGPKKAKVDDDKDFHITFPWKDFLGGWEASIPPLDVLGYAGWDKGELSMQGLVMHGLRGALPSLPSLGLQWSSADGAPIDRLVVEVERLSLGTTNAIEDLHLDPSPANLRFGEHVGLDGIELAGAYDEEAGARFSGKAEEVWFQYGPYRVAAGGAELAYDAAEGPSASLASFDVDLDGYFQVHGEGAKVGMNGLDLALLRLPVPRRVQEVLDSLSSIQWTMVAKDGGEIRSGAGVPALALMWRAVCVGPDGFDNVLPSLDPNPSDWLFSVKIGEVLAIADMTCALEGVEDWAFEPDAPSPTFDFSAQQATLSLFGATLSGTAARIHVSLDTFDGELGLLQLGASPIAGLDLEAHMSDAHVSPAGFSAGAIGAGFHLTTEVLGALADRLGPLADAAIGVTLDLVGVSFDATQGLGVEAFGLEAVAITIDGLGRLEIPIEVIKDVLVNGFGSRFVSALVDAVIATFQQEIGELVSEVVELINDAAEFAKDIVEAAWDMIVAWVPGLTETPPEMGPRDTALARHLGEKALWPEVFAQIRSLDDGVTAIEVFDRDLMEEARACITSGAVAAGFEKLVELAESEAHVSLAFWQTSLAAADAILAAPPSPEATPDAEAAPATIDPNNHQSRDTFVRSQVKENADTTAIIDALYPHFPKDALVIGGYLNDNEQFWKVNFHWEWMLWIIDEASAIGPSAPDEAELRDIQATLRTNPPNPAAGYIPDTTMTLQDASTAEVIVERWAMMKGQKTRLKAVWDRSGLPDKAAALKPGTKELHLAAAPVAKPGTSKHGTGKALDIAGDNALIVTLAKELGATLAFDEASHVHVEFLNGVKAPATGTPD